MSPTAWSGGELPEQTAGRLRLEIEKGLQADCTEMNLRLIYRAGHKAVGTGGLMWAQLSCARLPFDR
jgi:hypothetical protein